MADVTPILIKDLAAQTTLQDTDYFIVGGEDAKKITVGQMKEALGINELNTKLDMEGTGIHSRVPFYAIGSHAGCSQIPFPNADKYNISVTSVSSFGDSQQAIFAWVVIRSKSGFSLQVENPDAVYYFSTLYPNRLWDVFFNAVLI